MALRATNGSVSGNRLTKNFAAAFANGKHRGELKDIKGGLMAAGNMLVRLGLADPDQKSVYRFHPNKHLQGIKLPNIRLRSRKESAGIDDKNDLDAVCYPRVGQACGSTTVPVALCSTCSVSSGWSDMLRMVMKW